MKVCEVGPAVVMGASFAAKSRSPQGYRSLVAEKVSAGFFST
jgi:hypothetical protein